MSCYLIVERSILLNYVYICIPLLYWLHYIVQYITFGYWDSFFQFDHFFRII